MLGIGAGLGIPAPITAGMAISGAYVGDKFSPLSDTTNLAAAVSETGLFDHVTAMVSSTAPTFVIAIVLYAILGAAAALQRAAVGYGQQNQVNGPHGVVTLEDCGTLWAVMFPWTGCGAYQQTTLGMSPFVYFPFAFVNLLKQV